MCGFLDVTCKPKDLQSRHSPSRFSSVFKVSPNTDTDAAQKHKPIGTGGAVCQKAAITTRPLDCNHQETTPRQLSTGPIRTEHLKQHELLQTPPAHLFNDPEGAKEKYYGDKASCTQGNCRPYDHICLYCSLESS